MLILVRKSGERLKIGDEVTLTVLDVMKHGVRLGIDAPKSIIIAREELGEWDVLRKPKNSMIAAKDSGRLGENNVWTDADCSPALPTDATPGSPEKVNELRRRAENGESLWSQRDTHKRLHSHEDIAAWVEKDMSGAIDTRRMFKFRKPLVLIVKDRAVAVDHVALRGCAMVLRDADTLTWFPADDVSEEITSEPMRSIVALVNGKGELGEEVNDV